MSIENKLEYALRKKMRWASPAGTLTLEDLWDLPLTSKSKANLDDIARELFAGLQNTKNTVSFVEPTKVLDTMLQVSFDIVKHIIDVKLAERAAAAEVADRAAKKQKLMELIASKKDEALSSKSLDELQAELASL